MSQHRVIAINTTFAASSGFDVKWPNIGYAPDYFIVRQVAADFSVALRNPVTLSCQTLGGPVCCFMVQDSASAVGAPVNALSPQTMITYSGGSLDGQSIAFTVTRPDNSSATLTGTLTVLLEAVKKAPKKSS